MMSAVLATLSGSYPPLEGRSPTCYSAVRHCTPKGAVRLACFRHAASVYPEPGSNSPSELSEVHPSPLQAQNGLLDDLSIDRHAPHHSSIVNVLRALHQLATVLATSCVSRPTCHYSRSRQKKSQGRPWHRPIVPRSCPRSIVGAGAFHDRVREGNGWDHPASATRATA